MDNKANFGYIDVWTALPIKPVREQVIFVDNEEKTPVIDFLKRNDFAVYKLFMSIGLYFQDITIPFRSFGTSSQPLIIHTDEKAYLSIENKPHPGHTIFLKDEMFNDKHIGLGKRKVICMYACEKMPTPCMIKFIQESEREVDGINKPVYIFSYYHFDSYEDDNIIKEHVINYFRILQSGIQPKAIQARVINTKLPFLKDGMSRILIDENNRILLVDLDFKEVILTPLQKTVYFFFLKHPEGILFKHIAEYQDELEDIYKNISNRESLEGIKQSIADLTNPIKNSINEKCSRIRESFLAIFEESIASEYWINGKKGELKTISLDRRLITWKTNI